MFHYLGIGEVSGSFPSESFAYVHEFFSDYIIYSEVEFWAGKPSRLHDRVRYLRTDERETPWRIERLAP